MGPVSDDTHPPEWYAAEAAAESDEMEKAYQEAKRAIALDPERQLKLHLERRHAEGLRFLDRMGLRLEYETHMDRMGLASEFVSETYEKGEVMSGMAQTPDWGMEKAVMDGAIGQFGIELEYLDKSIQRLRERVGPILRTDLLEMVSEDPKAVPVTDLRKLLDRLGALRSGLDRITDSVDL